MTIHFQCTLQTFKMQFRKIMSIFTSNNASFILISLYFRGTAIVKHHGMPVIDKWKLSSKYIWSAGNSVSWMLKFHHENKTWAFTSTRIYTLGIRTDAYPTHAQIWMAVADCQSQLKFIVNEGSNSCLCFHKGSKTPLKLQVSARAPLSSDAAAHRRTCNTQGPVYPHWKSN